jgi:hypothetical protein
VMTLLATDESVTAGAEATLVPLSETTWPTLTASGEIVVTVKSVDVDVIDEMPDELSGFVSNW